MRIVCCGSKSVVTWRRARMVPLAQDIELGCDREVAFTSEDRVQDASRSFHVNRVQFQIFRATGRRTSRCAAAGDQNDRQGKAGRL